MPTNIGAAAALVGLARAAGLGAGGARARPGRCSGGVFRTGALAAVPIVAGVAAAVAVPRTRALLADEKITGTGRAEAAFETFVRIPLETALAEEIIFRGVLLGLALRSRTPLGAVASSSIWFGLWHVYPTLGSLGRGAGRRDGGRSATPRGRRDAVVVVSTAAAGAVLRGPAPPVGQHRRADDRPRGPQHGGVFAGRSRITTGRV